MMEQSNPYRAPSVDVSTLVDDGDYDQSSPLSPKGRFGRLSYLAWTMLFGIVMDILLFALAGKSLFMPGVAGHGPNPMFFLFELGVMVIFIPLVIRRLHDFNASGWWSLLFMVPMVNAIFGLVLLFKRGTDGANRFGPPRLTRGWEKGVGYIGIGFMVLAVVGGIAAAILIPMFAH